MIRLLYTSFFLVSLLANTSFGQSNFIFNPESNHFLLNKGQTLPSAYEIEKTQINLRYQNKTGIFSDLRDIYFDALVKTKQAHTLGLKVYSEQETFLFSKSKILAIYAYNLKLAEEVEWKSGIQAGVANVYFGSTDASAGGSSWNGDAAISTTLCYRKWKLALGLQQLPASNITPINYEFQLKRYLEAYLSKKIALGPDFEWQVGARTISKIDTAIVMLDNKLMIKESFGFICMLNSTKLFSAGIFVDIPQDENKLRLTFNYAFSFSSARTNQSLYSIGISYFR